MLKKEKLNKSKELLHENYTQLFYLQALSVNHDRRTCQQKVGQLEKFHT
jgi:hypothetical protein